MKQYPPQKDIDRLAKYETYEMLFMGNHRTALRGKLDLYASQFAGQDPTVRYVVLPYPRIISTISADLLFEEQPKIVLQNERNQDFIDKLFYENSLWTTLYEEALVSSYKGDSVMRILAVDGQIRVDTVKPDVYFPVYNESNVKTPVKEHVLAYRQTIDEREYLVVETYRVGEIETQVYDFKNSTIGGSYSTVDLLGIEPIVKTNIGEGYSLIHHIKNWGMSGKFWGISDYEDLVDLFFAINNRLSRNEHILDKHGDPILAVPQGVLDGNGNVSRQNLGMIELPSHPMSGEASKPEYIVWDSKLESSFAQIDVLLEQLWISSQMSPTLFGLTKYGVAESGRALKYKLLRTLSLKHRKQMYWDNGIKAIVESAIEFARNNKLTTDGIAPAETEVPTIYWQDGIIMDELEILEAEKAKLDYELTTKEDAISNVDGITSNEAQDKLTRIQTELDAKNKANPFSMVNRGMSDNNDDDEDDDDGTEN
jgi:Phage portal protein, SPP1 Gp6-like.